jgi:hypothetical protein
MYSRIPRIRAASFSAASPVMSDGSRVRRRYRRLNVWKLEVPFWYLKRRPSSEDQSS